MTTMTTQTQSPKVAKVLARIQDLIDWCDQHNNDVNGGAFIDECRSIAFAAADAVGVRAPMMIYNGAGAIDCLDYACGLVGLHVPTNLSSSRLPGASEFRSHAYDEE